MAVQSPTNPSEAKTLVGAITRTFIVQFGAYPPEDVVTVSKSFF
jgi:hypothetical protein